MEALSYDFEDIQSISPKGMMRAMLICLGFYGILTMFIAMKYLTLIPFLRYLIEDYRYLQFHFLPKLPSYSYQYRAILFDFQTYIS